MRLIDVEASARTAARASSKATETSEAPTPTEAPAPAGTAYGTPTLSAGIAGCAVVVSAVVKATSEATLEVRCAGISGHGYGRGSDVGRDACERRVDCARRVGGAASGGNSTALPIEYGQALVSPPGPIGRPLSATDGIVRSVGRCLRARGQYNLKVDSLRRCCSADDRLSRDGRKCGHLRFNDVTTVRRDLQGV